MIAHMGREDCSEWGTLRRGTHKLILQDQRATVQRISFGGVFPWALGSFPKFRINCVASWEQWGWRVSSDRELDIN